MRQVLVLGGPGAGKTERLLRVMEEALSRGVEPAEVAFVAFTRTAAHEARERAQKAFGLTAQQLPYFRTLHSLCFKELALKKSDVMGREQLDELAEITGELHSGHFEIEGPAAGKQADPLLTLDQYARTARRTLRQAWEDHGGNIEWFRLLRFTTAYAEFRTNRGLLDFTDMLERYAEGGAPVPVRVAIVDEAQDLTALQWEVTRRAFGRADEMWVAGDDDQSINRWAGAAEDYFLSLPFEREVLPLSHRLPRSVWTLSQSVAARIGRRYEKAMGSQEREGLVNWVAHPEEVDMTKGTWLLLARTRYLLAGMEAEARQQGVLYRLKGTSSVVPEHLAAIAAYEDLRAGKRVEGTAADAALRAMGVRKEVDEERSYTAAELAVDCSTIWHDALIRIDAEDREYYLACLRRGEKLKQEPRVRIDTIHGAKGAEADRVLLGTDMTYKVRRGYELDPDSEHRVFYVGVTRAKEELHLMAPKSVYGYPL